MLNIVLFQPEIPPNTGNIVRLCANSGFQLHLIEPLGFDLDEKKVRRAGLDYHEFTKVKRYPNFQAYVDANTDSHLYACTTKGSGYHSDVSYKAGDSLVFGPETRGLPDDVLQIIGKSNWVKIPMQPDSRSMNLSNAVSVFVYESWRQLGYEGSK
ncbi:tRNA (uridine(34)/cytosine(34)/5-carboxymethylaminomethyluridine (34)-2'-O)-methyltransferase TrmL [Psychrosphaera haliotis]|uniref:tRNA (uridine(34)/cytosine(34)/5- carboxymethylaminomethyluridine(34)-2'-O)- methyltransferase TrmL n=1 Tax=Psychrosphaera haliotis TaxID=555083 RepID=UPI0031E416C3